MRDGAKELCGKIKELYDEHHGSAKSICVAAGTNLSFILLNNALFPVRDVVGEIFSRGGIRSVLTRAYFEGQKDVFQCAMGNVGYELVNEKFKGLDEGRGAIKFLYRASSCALGGAVFEAFRSGLGLFLTEVMKYDPNYIYKYVIEPRSEAPWEIVRSVVFGLIYLYLADRFRKTRNNL